MHLTDYIGTLFELLSRLLKGSPLKWELVETYF